MALDSRPGIGPIIDCNAHLWDQRDNAVFWLSDRTVVRDMLGDYDSLPDSYTLSDYWRDTSGYDVRGVIWSDAGVADPLAAADWVNRLVRDNLALLASSGLVATIEATSGQLGIVTRLAEQFPSLRIVIDHFGWPEAGLGGTGLAGHIQRLAGLAAADNAATRIDAIGTIFGDWTLSQIRPWLLEVASTFGPERCMLGSDLPIENLRSGFGPLYCGLRRNLLRLLRRRAGHVVPPHRGALVCPGRRLKMPGVNLSQRHGADRSGWS